MMIDTRQTPIKRHEICVHKENIYTKIQSVVEHPITVHIRYGPPNNFPNIPNKLDMWRLTNWESQISGRIFLQNAETF